MPDEADKVVADEERAMALFEHQRQQRIAESFRGYDPTQPIICIDCGNEVPVERLRVLRHASRCAACASGVELRLASRAPT